ncbi:MAG: hypothetical protein IT169_02755 [Bryobacterales bacterium]|nr:hypothetical protein [Bryobacterales bacterium]
MRPVILLAMFAVFSLSVIAQAQPVYLVQGGKPGAVIVLGRDSSPFYRFVGDELYRYVKSITGASLEISDSSAPASEALTIAIGGPDVNPLVREAADKKLVDFEGLTQDGYVLMQTKLSGRNVLIAGGNQEAATMYAVYELIERFGVTFLLTKDILPERSAELRVPTLPGRVQTPFPQRGFFISNIYPNRGMMDLAEVKAMLDQMAKLKMNYLQFFWFEHEPWIDFTYNGEHKLIGDATGPESGYLTWRYHFGSYLVKDLSVGRELFKGKKKIAPAEFQDVETPEQAYTTAKAFLNEIIRYSKSRKIKVWLCIDPTTLPGNLARYARRATNLEIPFHPILGAHMCPADPVLHEINESRFKALVETYPDAEGYFLYLPEMFPNCPDERDRNFLLSQRGKYDGLLKLWAPFTAYERDPGVVLDSNIGSIHIAQQLIAARDRIAPKAKLGIGGIGRAFVLPVMDKLFAKEIPFADMESRAIWTPTGVPMEDFGGMGKRERILVPRMDDDSSMFGMQFNLNLYYKDRVLLGSLENGVAGLVGQLNRPRGTEQNYLYLADGSWNPKLTPEEFYADYARRVFGEGAAEDMRAAFRALEENEEMLGWTGRSNFGCCGVIPEVAMAHSLYKQPNPFDGPVNWDGFISGSHDRIRYFTHSVVLLNRALQSFDRAAARVEPRGREELNYLKNKTQSYVLLFETLIAARRGYIVFDEAFRARKSPADPEFIRKLDESLRLFAEARRLGRKTTETFAEDIDHTSDLGVLYRANLFLITGLELAERTMANINNFHHGKQYTGRVEWNKIYYDFPEFARQR